MRERNAGLYSSGEFAKMNSISKKTLRVYEEMGVLKPVEINKASGYRFYAIDQCSTVDAIQHIQSLGASLSDIQRLLENSELTNLERFIEQRKASIGAEINRLQLALYNADKMLAKCRRIENGILFDTIIFEQLPERFALTFPILNEKARNLEALNGADYLCEWELNLRRTKAYMLENGLPAELFHNMGCTIGRESLLRRSIELEGSFVFIDDENLAQRFGAERVSEGIYLVIYKNSYLSEGGRNTEVGGILELIDFARSMNLEIVGDYYGEIIADTPAFQYQGREMLYKLQVRVAPAAAI